MASPENLWFVRNVWDCFDAGLGMDNGGIRDNKVVS